MRSVYTIIEPRPCQLIKNKQAKHQTAVKRSTGKLYPRFSTYKPYQTRYHYCFLTSLFSILLLNETNQDLLSFSSTESDLQFNLLNEKCPHYSSLITVDSDILYSGSRMSFFTSYTISYSNHNGISRYKPSHYGII